jgi:hypothetical protein
MGEDTVIFFHKRERRLRVESKKHENKHRGIKALKSIQKTAQKITNVARNDFSDHPEKFRKKE